MSFRLVLSECLTFTRVDERTVLFNRKTGDFFGINESTCTLLERLQEQDLDSVVHDYCRQYKVDAPTLRRDVLELVAALEQHHLARRAPTGPSPTPV